MPANSISRSLGERIVREKEAHDLSRNPEFANFQFIGYRASAVAMELVALCDADGLTEGDVVRLRDEFFGLVRRLPHDYGLKPRGRNPNGLLGFVFADGCPEPMARFIRKQTRISHAAGTGGVSVAWAINVPARRIHTHDRLVSILPPVFLPARTVYPGLKYLASLLDTVQVPQGLAPATGGGESIHNARPKDPSMPIAPPIQPSSEQPAEARAEDEPAAYDAFISYASEDLAVALPLAQALNARGVRVWLDEIVLKLGDSRQQSTDQGMASSRFGIVLVSRDFVRTQWAQRQFAGLTIREVEEGRTVVLPIRHQITAAEVRAFSPPLADKVSLDTLAGIPAVAEKIAQFFRSLPSTPASSAGGAGTARREERGGEPGPVHILFLAADPRRSRLDLEGELERIETNLRMSRERERLHLKAVVAGSFDRLSQAMLDDSPTIVHFAGHGRTKGLVMRDAAGEAHVVPVEALAELFMLFRDTVKCVVLNACWTEPQARAVRQHIPHVIGIRERIRDATSIAFATGFYQAIGAGRDVPFAFRMGIAHAKDKGRGDEDLITLF